MKIVQSEPSVQYSQSNGTIVKKSGGGRRLVEVPGEDETIEETETIIKKTIIKKKGKSYVRCWKFSEENALEKFAIVELDAYVKVRFETQNFIANVQCHSLY